MSIDRLIRRDGPLSRRRRGIKPFAALGLLGCTCRGNHGPPVRGTIPDRNRSEGEFTAYARSVPVRDLKERRFYREALFDKIGFRPENTGLHLLSVDTDRAAYAVIKDGDRFRKTWRPG